MRRRVFLMGFDGLCPRLVESYLDRLPGFQRFCRRACWGTLETVFPPVSPAAWGAVLTGQPPETMGIYGWRRFFAQPFRTVPVTRGDIQVPTIFGHLAETGKRFGMIGFPLSNPPHSAAAVWVRGFADASSGNDDPIHPPSVKELLARHLIRLEFDVLESPRWGSDYDVYLRYRQACDESRIRAAKLLFEELDLDLMMVLYSFTDNVIHTCRNEDDLISAYVEADRVLGHLMDHLDEDVLLMVLSDHGVEAKRLEVALNQVLLKAGLLHLNEDVPAEKVSVQTFRDHVKRQEGLTGDKLMKRCRQFAKLTFEQQRSRLWNDYMLRGTW
jgi:predicted AlkP superfamily phosphohydrolase/phosphomutase